MVFIEAMAKYVLLSLLISYKLLEKSYQFYIMDSLNSSSDFKFLQFIFQFFRNCSKEPRAIA